MKSSFLLLSFLTVLLATGCQTDPLAAPETEERTMETHTENIEADEEVQAVVTNEEVYQEYSEEAYSALLGKAPVALFFHASWCPTCVAMEKDIKANLSGFPEGSVILKADYDTETELKAKYGITSQSVVVILDKNGEVDETLVFPSATELQTEFANLMQ